jgi:hypothetical protein
VEVSNAGLSRTNRRLPTSYDARHRYIFTPD